MDVAVGLTAIFVGGLVLLLLGSATGHRGPELAGAKIMATAIVGFPLLSAITHLTQPSLPPDASVLWRAFDVIVSVAELAFSIAAMVWIVRLRRNAPSDVPESRAPR